MKLFTNATKTRLFATDSQVSLPIYHVNYPPKPHLFRQTLPSNSVTILRLTLSKRFFLSINPVKKEHNTLTIKEFLHETSS